MGHMTANSLAEECRALIRRAAAQLGAVDAGVLAELQSKLEEAQATLPQEEVVEIEKFAAELRSCSSLWLFHHQLRVKPDLAWQGPHGVSNAASATEQALAEQIAATMKRAYWDKAREDLAQQPPNFGFLLGRVDELLDTIAGFVPEPRRKALKEQTLDADLLQSQVENGAFDRESLIVVLQRISHTLMQLESPFQSERTAEWLAALEKKEPPTDITTFHNEIVDGLAYLFEKCDTLRTEAANFRLRMTQVKERQGLERKYFVEMLKSGAISMEASSNWLKESGSDNVEIAIVKSFSRLLQQKRAIPMELCPEPMRCDLQRLQDFQSGLQGVALLALVAALTAPLLPQGAPANEVAEIFHAVREEVERPQPSMKCIQDAIHDKLVVLRRQCGAADLEDVQITNALESLKKCLGEDVPAFRLLHDRTLSAFDAALGPPKREVPEHALGEKPWTMQFAVERLNALIGDAWSFIGDHVKVYKPLYSYVHSQPGGVPSSPGGTPIYTLSPLVSPLVSPRSELGEITVPLPDVD